MESHSTKALSTNIDYWAEKIKDSNNLVLADYSSNNMGRACGDHIRLDVDIKDDFLYFGVTVQGCLFAKASAAWMLEITRGKRIEEVKQILLSFKTEIYNSVTERSSITGPWKEMELNQNKIACLLAPWEALTGILDSIISEESSCGINNNDNKLVCDACVVVNKIKWHINEEQNKKDKYNEEQNHVLYNPKSSYEILKELYRRTKIKTHNRFEDKYLRFQRYGKIVLNDLENVELKSFIKSIDSKSIDHLRRMRFMSILEYHCKQLNIQDISPELSYYFTRAYCKSSFQGKALADIQNIINAYNISAVFVKGSKTKALYEPTAIRYSNDIDILTENLSHTFQLCFGLMKHLGVQFSLDNGIVFSTKYILDSHRPKMIGHLHLKKEHGSHNLNIDISFPGMSIGLLNTTHFPNIENNTLTYDDQFIITLSHLLKHEIPYIKDINDLYLIIKKEKINAINVFNLLEKYSLIGVAYIVISYIINEIDSTIINSELYMKLLKNNGALEKKISTKIMKRGWPYTIGSQYLFQQSYLFNSFSSTHSVNESLRMLNTLLLTKDEEKQIIKIDNMEFKLNTRYYWLPLIIFKEILENANINHLINAAEQNYHVIENNTLLFKSKGICLAVTVIGIFLLTDSFENVIKKDEIKKTLDIIIKTMGCSKDNIIIMRTVNSHG